MRLPRPDLPAIRLWSSFRITLALRPRCLGIGLALLSAVSASADSRIWIPVKINGQPMKFIFDTGSSDTVLFRHTADRIGLHYAFPPPGTPIAPGQIPAAQSDPVNLTLHDQAIPAVRLKVIADPPGQLNQLDGLVGWPNLRNNDFIFTGANVSFRFLKAGSQTAADGVRFFVRADNNLLAFASAPGDSVPPVYVGVDSGSDHGVHLSPARWRQWRQSHPDAPLTLTAYFTPAAGLVVAEESWARSIDLAGLELTDVAVAPSDPAVMANYPADTIAVIGLEGLRRLNITYQAKSGSAYLSPVNRAPQPYVHNMIGAVFVPASLDSDPLVAHVIAGSPAAKAGVRDGDILLKIDQLDVTPWRTTPGILPLRRFFCQAPGTVLHLTLRRGERTFVADVALKTILGPAGAAR